MKNLYIVIIISLYAWTPNTYCSNAEERKRPREHDGAAQILQENDPYLVHLISLIFEKPEEAVALLESESEIVQSKLYKITSYKYKQPHFITRTDYLFNTNYNYCTNYNREGIEYLHQEELIHSGNTPHYYEIIDCRNFLFTTACQAKTSIVALKMLDLYKKRKLSFPWNLELSLINDGNKNSCTENPIHSILRLQHFDIILAVIPMLDKSMADAIIRSWDCVDSIYKFNIILFQLFDIEQNYTEKTLPLSDFVKFIPKVLGNGSPNTFELALNALKKFEDTPKSIQIYDQFDLLKYAQTKQKLYEAYEYWLTTNDYRKLSDFFVYIPHSIKHYITIIKARFDTVAQKIDSGYDPETAKTIAECDKGVILPLDIYSQPLGEHEDLNNSAELLYIGKTFFKSIDHMMITLNLLALLEQDKQKKSLLFNRICSLYQSYKEIPDFQGECFFRSSRLLEVHRGWHQGFFCHSIMPTPNIKHLMYVYDEEAVTQYMQKKDNSYFFTEQGIKFITLLKHTMPYLMHLLPNNVPCPLVNPASQVIPASPSITHDLELTKTRAGLYAVLRKHNAIIEKT